MKDKIFILIILLSMSIISLTYFFEYEINKLKVKPLPIHDLTQITNALETCQAVKSQLKHIQNKEAYCENGLVFTWHDLGESNE